MSLLFAARNSRHCFLATGCSLEFRLADLPVRVSNEDPSAFLPFAKVLKPRRDVFEMEIYSKVKPTGVGVRTADDTHKATRRRWINVPAHGAVTID